MLVDSTAFVAASLNRAGLLIGGYALAAAR